MPDFWKGDPETAPSEDRAPGYFASLQAHAQVVNESSGFYALRFDGAEVDYVSLDNPDALGRLPAAASVEIIAEHRLLPSYRTMIRVDPGETIRRYMGPGLVDRGVLGEGPSLVIDRRKP